MSDFKQAVRSGRVLAGTFQKTASHDVVEVLSLSGLDFVCLDAEHAPFGRRELDTCLALARAKDFPALVRVPTAHPSHLLQALDSGAVGVVVPHVASAQQAQELARAARFGHGGRGFAGSTRWAGFATRPMADVLAQSQQETVVFAQIEEPEAVEAADEIAAVDGIDGLFVGPADLSVCLGLTDPTAPAVRDAMRHVGEACKRHGKAFMTFAPDTGSAAELHALGVSLFFMASDHSFMLNSARSTAADLHALDAS